jgi:antitoxin component YwqK of YwqJK toxin-antitoxin module
LLDDKLHRDDGPAYIEYYENGNIRGKTYFLNGNYHRPDGPAIISYYENGNVDYKSYNLNGQSINVKNDKGFLRWQRVNILL